MSQNDYKNNCKYGRQTEKINTSQVLMSCGWSHHHECLARENRHADRPVNHPCQSQLPRVRRLRSYHGLAASVTRHEGDLLVRFLGRFPERDGHRALHPQWNSEHGWTGRYYYYLLLLRNSFKKHARVGCGIDKKSFRKVEEQNTKWYEKRALLNFGVKERRHGAEFSNY